MLILKYIISFVLGIASASFLSIILTVLRVGLPMCQAIKNDANGTPQYLKDSANKLKSKYYISLLIDSVLVIVISLIIYFFMRETFIFYLVLVIFYTLLSFNKTGMTETNISEVENSLRTNF